MSLDQTIQAFIIPEDKQAFFPIKVEGFVGARMFTDSQGRKCVPVRILMWSTLENLFNAVAASAESFDEEKQAWFADMVALWQWAATQTPVETTIPGYEE